MNANLRPVCADCGCEIDNSPGGQSYIIDADGFHHAKASDCGKGEKMTLPPVYFRVSDIQPAKFYFVDETKDMTLKDDNSSV